MKTRLSLIATAAACAIATPSVAAEEDNDPRIAELEAQIFELQKEKAEVEAKKQLVQEEKALLDARIAALGLPSFENQTTIAAEGGKMEAMLLGSAAVFEAAAIIAKGLGNGSPVVLAGTETAPWGDSLTVESLLRLRADRLEKALADWLGEPVKVGLLGGAETATAAITAAAKLFGEETTVAPLSFSMTDALLARAVSAKLGSVYRPEAILTFSDENQVIATYQELQNIVAEAERAKRSDPVREDKNDDWATLQAEIKAANTLLTELTSAEKDKSPPLFTAARYSQVLADGRKIATIHLDYSGGSRVSRKNIETFFGHDPVRISGGLIATYTLADPSTGMIEKSGMVACRTAYTSLRSVQNDTWGRPANGTGLCQQIGSP